MGTLYVVATPIGNLDDMTFRAVRILREVALIAAEDTRKSGRLLKHFEIDTPMTSYFEHNKLAKLERVLQTLRTADVALISDAGTPGISDPGYKLVRAALDAGCEVIPVPGCSAIITALSASGLPSDRFTFLGFLPRKAKERKTVLQQVAKAPETLIFYEAPHRIRETVDTLVQVFGPERQAVLARELTKRFEEFWRGDLAETAGYLATHTPRGEFTVLVAGAKKEDQKWNDGIIGTQFILQLSRDVT